MLRTDPWIFHFYPFLMPTRAIREYWTIYRGAQVFLLSTHSAPRPPPLPSVNPTSEAQGDWEREATCRQQGRGWGRSQIIRPQKCLALCKSLNLLCRAINKDYCTWILEAAVSLSLCKNLGSLLACRRCSLLLHHPNHHINNHRELKRCIGQVVFVLSTFMVAGL